MDAAGDCWGEALAGESNVQFVPQQPRRNEVDVTGVTNLCVQNPRLHRLTVATVKNNRATACLFFLGLEGFVLEDLGLEGFGLDGLGLGGLGLEGLGWS